MFFNKNKQTNEKKVLTTYLLNERDFLSGGLIGYEWYTLNGFLRYTYCFCWL